MYTKWEELKFIYTKLGRTLEVLCLVVQYCIEHFPILEIFVPC